MIGAIATGNSAGLPTGLLLSHFATPWLLWIYRTHWRWFFTMVGFFALVSGLHAALGAELPSLFISSVQAITAVVIGFCAWKWLGERPALPLMQATAFFHILSAVIALVVLFTPWREWLWYSKPFTQGMASFPRLKGLSYEPSSFSMLCAPIWLYFMLRSTVTKPAKSDVVTAAALSIVLLLSLSLGAIAAAAAALIIAVLAHRARYKTRWLWAAGALVMLALVAPTPMRERLANAVAGRDGSTNGRTFYAYRFAWQIADASNQFVGAGLGQIKELAPAVVEKHYGLKGPQQIARIPSSVAETLAQFGPVGLVLRFALLLFLFVRFRVASSPFRLALFAFVFLFSLAGSFLFNHSEMVLWAAAFSGSFSESDGG